MTRVRKVGVVEFILKIVTILVTIILKFIKILMFAKEMRRNYQNEAFKNINDQNKIKWITEWEV